MNAIVKSAAQQTTGSNLMPNDMRSAMDLANMMAKAKLVPSHLQDKPGDCLLVIEQAVRWGMSPFAVAQSTSVISGKLMFEGKLVSAAVQSSGLLSKRLSYEFDGEGVNRAVTASATIRGEDEPRTIRCTLAEAKTNNGMWTKQPDQQLIYFSTRAWARRHTPEVMLGVYSPEEFDEPKQVPFSGPTIEAEAEAVITAPVKRTVREIVRDKLVAATMPEHVHAVSEIPVVKRALVEAPEDIREEIGAMITAALERVSGGADDAEVV